MRISDWSSDVCSSDLLSRSALTAQLHRSALDPAPAARTLIFARVLDRLADAARVGVGAGRGEDDSEPAVVFGRFAQRHARPAGELRLGSAGLARRRSEEPTSELQSLMRLSYAVLCLKKHIH